MLWAHERRVKSFTKIRVDENIFKDRGAPIREISQDLTSFPRTLAAAERRALNLCVNTARQTVAIKTVITDEIG